MRRTPKLTHVLIAVLIATSIALKAQVPFCASTIDFQTGTAQGFTFNLLQGATQLWHVTNNLCRANLAGHTTPFTLYYGIDGTCNYDTIERNSAEAISPVVNIAGYAGPITLNFNYLLFVEGGGFDSTVGAASGNGGAFTNVFTKANLINDNEWHAASADITSVVGANPSTAQVRFTFDTIDNIANATTGWHMDDIAICGIVGVPAAPSVVLAILAIFLTGVAVLVIRRRAIA